jgi:preprotein translocase subunit Sec63
MSQANAPTAKVLFRITSEDGSVEVETLWAYDLGSGHYRIDNLPFYAYCVSLHDVVLAPFSEDEKFPTFEKVLSKSGNRTIRVIFNQPPEPGNESERLLNDLVSIGSGFEGANKRYIAINIPSSVPLEDVVKILRTSEVDWEHADPTYDQIYSE